MKTVFAAAALTIAAMTTPVSAELDEPYPDRPIMMLVSYGAGGATDYQARIVTKNAGAEDALGMPIAILNKSGEGGRVGWNWLATRADKDGYTLAVYNVPHFIAQSVEGGVAYSTDSFEPIANWGRDPAVVVVAMDSPFSDLQDMIDFAKANPGTLTTSGAGMFVGHHIAALQIEKAAGIDIAYQGAEDGGADAMKSVVRGHVMAGINNMSDAYRAAEAGKVRVLAIADLERHTYLPDVPTLQELGVDVDDTSVNYRGIMAPKGTPRTIIDKLSKKLPAMFADDSVVQKMAAGGAPMQIMTRDQVTAMWARKVETLRVLLSDL